MPRDSPGYLVKLATLYLALMAGLLVGDITLNAMPAVLDGVLAIAVATVLGIVAAFGVLLGYYGLFLAAWAPLGSPARMAFVTVTVRLLIVTFVAVALLAPPDVETQSWYAGVGVVLSPLFAYAYVYRIRGGDPESDPGEGETASGSEEAPEDRA